MIGKKERTEDVYVTGGPRRYFRIMYSGIYDIDTILANISKWLSRRKYAPIVSEHTEGVTSAGLNVRMIMIPFRNVNEYIRFFIEIEIDILRGVDVLVEENGRQIKKQKGDIEIRTRSFMRKNYRMTFKGRGKEFFRRTYEAYVIKQELDNYEAKLRDETKELLDFIGEVLQKFRR